MDNQTDSLLDFFNLGKEFKKVTIQGSQTGGRVVRTALDEPPPETNDAHVNNEPLDYYEKYREAEKERMVQSATNWYGSTTASVQGGARSFHAMSGIESDTLAGSVTIPSNDMHNDHIDLTAQFNFKQVSRDAHQLPICAQKEKIVDFVQSYPVVVISGFTGCGKTTQVPQYILDKHAMDKKRVNIIVTQPRRLAARSVAERVCHERGWELGKLVGYQVGLDKANKTPDTRLLYVTTGVLKRMLIHKKDMNDWTHIILDEVHERDQDMDFVMLLCKQLQNSNSRGVKIILMSATMNEDKFCDYFPYVVPGNQPQSAPAIILPIKKKTNKVQSYFLENLSMAFPSQGQGLPRFEMGDAKLEDFCIEVCRSLIKMLDNLENQLKKNAIKEGKPVPETGAVLVFLPGLAEIQTVQEWLREWNVKRRGTEQEPKWWILPLHSSIPIEEHRLIFKKAPIGQRKIILSTNIAESSITVPDIVYVIDFCLTKNIKADQETNYPRLVLEWASKQQCVQRMGRAGRVQEGRVYRLVNSNFYSQLDEEHDAELKRAPLSKVVLDTKLLDFGSPKELLALTMDPPDLLKLQKTIVALKEMGAMLTTVNNQLSYDDGDLTVLGEVIAHLPVDVRIGKLIVYGHVFNVLEDAIIIAAGLNGKSVFTAPFEKRIQAYKNKLFWADRSFSDCFAILNAYKTWEQKLQRGEFTMGNRVDARKREQIFCENSFLQAKVLQEMKLQVDEIRKNLECMDIKKLHLQSGGPDRLGESENERHIILRLIMFGAFYPNFFQRQNNSDLEVQANRFLNNRDPKTCVYLTGFPTDQIPFGPLYENQLKSIFDVASSQNENTTVVVEGHNVFIDFKKPMADDQGAMSYNKKDLTSGIIPPVYVATKMRSACRNSIYVNLYTEDEAQRRLDDWKKALHESEEKGLNVEHVDQIKPPDMKMSSLEFSVEYINDPNNFWVHLKEVEGQDDFLQSIIGRNVSQLSPPESGAFEELVRTGAIVLAPFEDIYYRARVNRVDRNGFAMVFFIDYGNVERVKTTNLRIIDKNFIKQNPDIVKIPGLALECSLSHVQPNKLKSDQGLWSEDAIALFKGLIENSSYFKFGKIFSVTKASSGHSDFLVNLESMEVVYNGNKIELKERLLEEKFAEKATESFKSEEDNKKRTGYSSYNQAMQEHLNDYKGRYKIEKPKMMVTEDAKSQSVNCDLKGPFSPLEYSVTCAYRQGTTKLAKVEMDSVNSVLLDQHPSDPHDQWMVAAHVGISPNGQHLLLRNTTWLPTIPGLGALATMVFAPQWCRNYWSEDATQQMLDRWRPMLCPHDRSMALATKYLSLFLPTTKDIPPEKTWKLWLPELTMFWNTWGNSPNWEVDLMKLYSRLALHQVGVVDWEPHMSDLYTRFMASFNLPVTYGGSGVRIKLGLALGGNNSLASITRWIVSSIGGGSSSQGHLDRLLVALESYYHPANANGASDSLHSFVSLLCHFFIKRAHVERYNTKWASRVADDKKLTDQDILHFVTSLKPIAFHVLHNANEDLTRNVFNCLATLAPNQILPELLEKLHESTNTLTEPHKFTVCVQALSSCAGPLLRNYPAKGVDLLTMLLPGIDVNDIWKSTDTFVLMSDLLESMPVADQSHLSLQTDSERLLASKTAVMETFVIEFMNRVFTLIENTSRENIRPDTAKPDDYLSDEEVAADAAINETFLKIVANSSPDIFKLIFSQLQKYLRGKIVEPTVAGGILASMCKSVVLSYPEQGLAFFVPHLCQCVRSVMLERPQNQSESSNKIDEELQFHLQLLSEVISVKGAYLYRNKGSFILPYVSSICDLLDSTVDLPQKDEYELAQSILQSLLTYVVQVRLVERHPRVDQSVQGWGRTISLEELDVEWYKPGKEEMEVIRAVIERYLVPRLEALDQWAAGTKEMDKETLLRTMRCVYRQLHAISELVPPVQVTDWESVLSTGLSWLNEMHITLPNGDPIRPTVSKLMGRIQRRILQEGADDTDSLAAVITIHDVLLFSYGNDEEDINDHIDEHRIIKQHRLNRLVGSKLHLPNVHLDRISIQWESQIWLKNLLVVDSLSPDTVSDLLDLCTEKYSETRILSQELLLKVVARVGRSCHHMILPRLLACIKESPSVSHEMMKGALYVLNSEKHMFFYSWEAASQLWPALVNAQHSDKSSVDDILRDISIKVNRYYQDYSLYTLPVSTPAVPTSLLDLVRSHPDLPHSQVSSLDSQSLGSLVHCQSLETSLHQLVVAKGLHWRHNQMAVGMLLSMVTFDHTPSRNQVAMWLNLLLDDDRTIRLMAYQALEGIIKLVKLPGQKVPLADLIPDVEPEGPGLREDNEWLQYKGDMEPAELETYWSKPFLVKSYMGYWAWGRREEDKARLPHKPSVYQLEPESIRSLISQFFLDEGTVARFVELNSLEHEKGEDFFNMDRGLFLSFMFENIGPKLACVFQPYIERLVGSPEESQQRAAAEMMYGLVRGSRFWDFKSAEQLWSWLLPVFQQVLNNVTTETQSDWDFCFAGLSNKADPNRLRWLFELLVTQDNLVSQGAFKESSYLLFVGKCLSQNWRVRELYCRTYNILKEHWAHPYNNVRHQIASTLATLLAMDIPVMGAKPGWNVGKGFPTKKLFIDEVLPKLNLNFHNPEFSDCSREDSPVSTVGAQSNGSSEDVSMEVEDEETRRANHTLETVSLWICHQIRVSSVSLQEEMFQLLPYLCQFIGTERDQDVSQSCLQALCYLSACILPAKVVPTMLDMVRRIASSSSYKTKISMLEYLQVAVFTNFPALACNKEYVSQVQQLVVSLLQDDNLTVRQKAAKILGGLLHSGFLNGEAVPNLLADLRGRVRDRMKRQGKKFTREQGQEDKGRALQHHSGILGMCAFVEAFPYDVPKFVPPILMELSTHLNDPQPIPMTIKKSLQEFKRTHQDNWQEHKRKFTEDQLVVMTDLLVSQNYYA